MAAPSRMMLKSSSTAALNLFTKSKSILNRLPPRASVLVLTSPESGSSRFIDQLAASRLNSDETRLRFLNDQLLPVWFTRADEEMRMARGPRKMVESEDEGSETDEDDDFEDIEDFDSDEELDDGESEEDEAWKKVRTRSHRDFSSSSLLVFWVALGFY